MGEGGLKEGLLFAPIPQNIQAAAKPAKGASRRAGNAQGEDKGNNANAVRKCCQWEPTHNGRDRGGGNTTRDDGG
jgi:hypothetical protein